MLIYSYIGLGLVFLFTCLEMILKRSDQSLDDFLLNYQMLIGNLVIIGIQYFIGLNLLLYVFNWAQTDVVDNFALPFLLKFLACFLITDFLYYVKHYVGHKFSFFWKIHQVHHSSLFLNLSTAYRMSWFAFLINPIFYAPAVIIGFSPEIVLSNIYLVLIYNHLLHIDRDIGMGHLNKIFVSPNDHRIHHSCYKSHIDKNMGGVLNIWDKALGTYCKTDQAKLIYGTTEQKPLKNPFEINFDGWLKK